MRRLDLVWLWSAAFAALTAFVLVGMLVFLLVGSLPVLRHEGATLVSHADWSYRHRSFGALSMIFGTFAVAVVALGLATPVGVGAALFTSEIAPRRLRFLVKVLVELLAGIPSVVYGLLGVLLLRDWMFAAFEGLGLAPLSGDSLATAGVLLAIMVLPTVATLADDALQSVPGRDRVAARGLGLTRAETVVSVVLPRALPGILGAVLLALGRALGETIAVFLVVGRADNVLPAAWNDWFPWIDAGQTITSKLGGSETHIAMGDPLHASALFSLGLMLMTAVLLLSLGAGALRHRLAGEERR